MKIENRLFQNKKIGKENEDDLLVALDQSLFKIYKGNVADWEPLSSTLYSNAFQENSQSSCLADIPPYVDNNISIVAASQSDNAALSEVSLAQSFSSFFSFYFQC